VETIEKQIKTIKNSFIQKTRDNGDKFYCLKDKTDEEINDLIRECHGTDIFPDDFRFNVIHSFFYMVSNDILDYENLRKLEEEIDEQEGSFVDSETDFRNYDLTQWLGSHGSRSGFVDEAMQDQHFDNVMGAIAAGQSREIQQIFSQCKSALIQYLRGDN